MKLRITVEGATYDVDVEVLDGAVAASAPAAAPAPAAPVAAPRPAAAPLPPRPAGGPTAGGDKTIKAPIAGTVVAVKVKPGDAVVDRHVVVVMEAMKMETNIASHLAGKVKAVKVSAGQAVKAGEVLVELE